RPSRALASVEVRLGEAGEGSRGGGADAAVRRAHATAGRGGAADLALVALGVRADLLCAHYTEDAAAHGADGEADRETDEQCVEGGEEEGPLIRDAGHAGKRRQGQQPQRGHRGVS